MVCRQSKFNPQLEGLNEAYPSLPDVPDHLSQQPLAQQQYPSQGQPQPHIQGQPGQGLTFRNQIPGDPRVGSPSPRGHSQSPSPRPQMQYGPGYPQGQDMPQTMSATTGTDNQYVPLNEKWKRDSQIKGRGTGVLFPSQGQGKISNQLGQDYPAGIPQGHASPKPLPQPHVASNQGVYPSSHMDLSKTLPNQQVHRPGVPVPAGNPNPSHYQANMQYSVPNQQTMIYGQQSMVGYREVTNTVSTVETPVISPNKDGQAQIDQYGQVIGGHRHLQGTIQNTMNQARHAVVQQPTSAYANEQYWQQQMQQQRERMGQSQRGLQQHLPTATPGGLPSQGTQSGPNVPGQVHSIQGQVPSVQGQVQPVQGQQQSMQGQVQSIQGQGQSVQGIGQSVQGQSFQVSGQVPTLASHSTNTQQSDTLGQVQHPASHGMQGFIQPQYNQYQGQTFTSQGQQFQGTFQQNQPSSSTQTGFNQQTLHSQPQVSRPQFGTQQITNSQQHQAHGQVVPTFQQSGTSTHIQSQQPVPQMSQFDQQMQPQTMQQVPYSQPGVQSSVIQQPVIQTHQAGDKPNVQQQFPQQQFNSQTMPGVGQYQSLGPQQNQQAQPQQSVQPLQGHQKVPDTQQMQHQNMSQQFPQNQQYQQPTHAQPHSNFQTQQAVQNTHKQQVPQVQPTVPQHQQGPLGPVPAPTVQQRPGLSGSPHPAHFSPTPVVQKQPNMTETGHQSAQFQQGTQNFSPQHVPQPPQSPMPGVNVNQTSTPPPVNTQQTGCMTGQPATSQHSQQFQQYQQPYIQPQPQQQGLQIQGQTGQTFLPGKLGTSQGQSFNMTPQLQGQICVSQPVAPVGQQPGQSVQALQINQGYAHLSQSSQGQGQSGQRFTAPQLPGYPPSRSGGQSFASGQRLSTPTSGQGQIYPVQSHGQTMTNQGQQQQLQSNMSISTPSIPVPAYSETALNRQATMQMFQGQQTYPTQGQQKNHGIIQGQTFQGQVSQNYGHGQSTIPGQQVQSINNVHQISGPVSSGQGQSTSQTSYSMQIPGQQPPLQPQILQPTVVQKPKKQGQGEIEFQGESEGQSNFTPAEKHLNTSGGHSQQQAKSIQNTDLPTGTSVDKQFGFSQDLQSTQGK